jgi:hypothetical protein
VLSFASGCLLSVAVSMQTNPATGPAVLCDRHGWPTQFAPA